MAIMDEQIKRDQPASILGPTLSRRGFIKAGGILVVGFSFAGPELLKGDTTKPTTFKNSLDPTLPSSWIEIHPDNTVLIRTGKSDFGQGSTFTAYRQIVAEELSVPFEAITTVITGDTDRTPDGSGAFDFLGHGMPNIRKAAAYTYQAMLDLASEKLGVPKDKLSVKDGIVSGGGKSNSYGDLVKDQQLKLTIPVKGDLTSIMGLTIEGNPPMKPVSEYTVIGKSFKNSIITSKVQAKETWATDVRLPGMLHARMIHPKTLGSTLVSAGSTRQDQVPELASHRERESGRSRRAHRMGSHSGRRAARQRNEVVGLEGPPRQREALRAPSQEADWKSAPVAKSEKSKGDVDPVLASAHKKHSATYQLPYMKHAPIGPTMAVADVKSDGTVHIYMHNQNPQALRGEIAAMLGTTPDHVIVHSYPGPGHYGRSNGGNSGAEDEAVLLSQAVGKPVRVQWMRPEDMQWSTQSPAAFSDVQIAIDEKGKIAAYQIDHYMPAMQDDRPVGAILAGLPTMSAPDVHSGGVTSTVNGLEDPWIYAPFPT